MQLNEDINTWDNADLDHLLGIFFSRQLLIKIINVCKHRNQSKRWSVEPPLRSKRHSLDRWLNSSCTWKRSSAPPFKANLVEISLHVSSRNHHSRSTLTSMTTQTCPSIKEGSKDTRLNGKWTISTWNH